MVSDDVLAANGLYDPDDPGGEERLRLVRYLLSLGASVDELRAYCGELPGLAMVLALRGADALTLEQVAARSSLPAPDVRRIVRAAGLADPGPDERVFAEGFVGLCGLVVAGGELFGEEAVLQLVRVLGSSMARVAGAMVSSFIANIEPGAREGGRAGLGVAQANVEAAALFPAVAPALDALLRQHLVTVRWGSRLGGDGLETRDLCVGFVDLVDSTAAARRLSMKDLGAMLTRFENLTTDLVTAHGGRVIKFIGDEVLFTAPGGAVGCRIALKLAAAFVAHPSVPPVRVGMAQGAVLLRDGDVFGPVVNLAARAAKLGHPGEVLAPLSLAAVAGLPADALGLIEVHGFDSIDFCRLLPLDESH